MATLGTFVRQRIHELGKQQKEVALDVHDHLGGEGAREKQQTIEQKLSKLLNGHTDGERYFTSVPARLEALAHAIDCALDELAGVHERAKEAITLVLDPRLPEEAVCFLEQQSAETDTLFEIAKVDDVGTGEWSAIRDALRDVGRGVKNPLITLSSMTDGDADFFNGATLKVCLLIGYPRGGTPRGWTTNAEPNPVPELPPPPPARFDETGAPLLPSELIDADCAELARYSNRPHGHQVVLFRQWQTARSNDTEARYPVLAVVRRHLIGKQYESYGYVPPGSFVVHDTASPAPESALGVRLLDEREVTHVWLHDKRLFVHGPSAAAVDKLLGDHHSAHRCDDLMSVAADLLRQRNPWRDFRPWPEWDRVCAEMLERSGAQLAVSDKALERLRDEKHLPDSFLVTPGDSRADDLRGVLQDLARRPMQLTRGEVWLMARLQAVAEAPLIVLGAEPGRWCRVVADLGCGNLLEVFVRSFPAEEAPPLSIVWGRHPGGLTYVHALDGGDVRVEMWLNTDQALEGQRTRRNRIRREEEAEAAARAMEDAWDE